MSARRSRHTPLGGGPTLWPAGRAAPAARPIFFAMPRNDPTDTGGLFIGRRPGTAPIRFRERVVRGSPGRQRFDRLLAVGLLVLEGLLCLSLLGPQPAGWLWVGSQVQYWTGFVTAGITSIMLGCLASLFLTMVL